MRAYRIIWIKRLLPILTLLLPLQSLAQSIQLYPATAVAPRGAYQTVTAIVNGANDKTVTWTTSGGTLVGTNPCVVNEPCTIALYDKTAETDTLTATTNVGSVTATSTVTFTGSPTPATSHPRLLVTAAMLPGLRAKATAGNTLYQALRTNAINLYTTDAGIWNFSTWNGSACVGGSGPSSDQSQSYKEEDANLFAFMSMIDPSDSTYQWGCAGRDIFTYMMGQFIANPSAYAGNHWSDSSKPFSVTVDWLMAGGYLNATDLIQAREFLAAFAKFTVTNNANGTLAVIGNYNSSSQFDTGSEWDYTSQRDMGNNYTQSKMLYLVADALTFNDNTTDDPPLANTCSATRYQVCPDGTAGSLHAYWTYFTGGMMYKDWAHMEDPNVTWQAYQTAYGNLSTQPSCDSTWAPLGTKTPCFGLGRGGEPSEGNFYGYSTSRLKLALDAVYTAGYLDPIAYGPQMSLATSSYWDLRYITDLASLTGPILTTAGGIIPQGSMNFLNTGDENTYYKYPSSFVTESATLLGNSNTGRTEGNSAILWTMLNTAYGGPLGTSYGCTQYCGFDSELGNDFASAVAMDLFIAQPAGDPVASLPADPRPSLPTDLYDAGNQHIVVRNNWTASGTLFSYYAPNTAIDHEHEFDGRFDIYSNGEYITKGRAEFDDYNNLMTTAPQQNLVAYQNNPTQTNCTVANGCQNGYGAQDGGQWWHAEQGGLVTLLHSELPAYVAAIVDQSNAYNSSAYADYPNSASGITASRSLIYLRGSNQVVYYDRGNSGSNAWTKQLYQMTTGNPTFIGNVASWPTRSGTQKAYFTSLLPSGATITNAGLTAGGTGQAADWEPYTSLEVNAGSPTSTQFLSVLEWGASTHPQSTTTLVQSTGGQNFDCGKVGSSMVCFMRAWPATFTGVTYPASGATTQYVSDLTPNTTYTISGAGVPASATTDTAGVLTFEAAGTGNITVGDSTASIVVSIAVIPATLVLQTSASQQFTATCTYSDGSSADCTVGITWSSSASGVVTIDSSGMAAGVAPGTANIIATSGSIQGHAAVTVPMATLESIEVTPGPLTVPVGVAQQFQATGIYSNSTTVDMTSVVRWSSSNAAVVLPNSTGLASMKSQGSAVITAASGNVQGQVPVIVSAPATPSFSPAAGTYTSAQKVTIGTATPSATIYYTTNGTTPTTSSAVYSGPITVSSTETVQAIAVVSSNSTSAIGSASYTINPMQAATPSFSPAAGTYPSAQKVTIGTATPSATIYYTTSGTTPTTSSAVYSGPITVSSTETVQAIAVVSGNSTSAIGSAAYTINPTQAATPSFSPTAGTYTSAQKVTVGTATPSATIYYTTNGTTPTTGSAVYSGPITVSSTETVQAIAVVSGKSISAIGSAAYTINLTQAAAPSFSVDLLPASVSITNGQSGTTTVLVTPQNGFASAVSFSCSGLPAGVSCSFSPASVIPSGGAASTTLTVTTAPTIAAFHRHHSPLFPSSMMAIAVCCLGWKRRRGLHLLLLAGVAIGLSLCTGCGSSEVIPISASTSTVSVIATSGSMQPTTSFTLEVR